MSRRLTVMVALFAVSAALVAQRAGPVSAQNPKDKDKDRVAALEKQLRAAQADLQQSEKQVTALKQQVNALQVQNAKLEAALKKEQVDDDKALKALRRDLDAYRGAGLVHVVVLKLKSDSPAGEVQSLVDDVYGTLGKIKSVRGVWAGRPAAKGSDVAVTDYGAAFVVLFDDAAGLKQYLDDPLHKKFVDKHASKWEAPTVYDFEPRKNPRP